MSAQTNVQEHVQGHLQGNVLPWTKPAREQHAHVGEDLAKYLPRLTPAAQELALYLFRICIAGKLNELNIYFLPLGTERMTGERAGRTYSRNTLRSALSQLIEHGLVIIDREFRGGWFRLTVQHPGPTRPFAHTKPEFSKFRSFTQEIDKNSAETIEIPYSNTEDLTEAKQTPLAAAKKIVTAEENTNDNIPSDFHSQQNVTLENTDDPEFDPPSAILSPENNYDEADLIEDVEEVDETAELEDSDCDSDSGIKQPPQEDPQAEQILRVVRDAMPINPQLEAEVVKYSLAEVVAAVALYNERNARPSSTVKNHAGFLTQALRERWAFGGVEKATSGGSQYPPELTRWYEWAIAHRIVEDRPLESLPLSRSGTPGNYANDAEYTQVYVRSEHLHEAMEHYPSNLHGRMGQLMGWRRAMELYPMRE